MTEDDIERLLADDDELREGIERALRINPSRLRRLLEDLGYLDNAVADEEVDLTPAEEELLEVVDELGTPKSTGEIVDIIQAEYPEKIEQFGSMKHRTWVNDKLNSLVKKGLAGKFREGRTVRFTPSPKEAVRHWARQNSRFVSDIGFDDLDEIIDDTGMNRTAVTQAITALDDES